MEKQKIVLVYSGGLDTSIILTWLKEKYDCEVIAVCCDAGQKEDFKEIEEKAYKTGASKAYLLGTSMARPLMAKTLVEIAEKEGAFYICHGCTGKGNDQVRFETTIKALNPAIKVIAPWRIWDMHSREDLIQYAKDHDIPIHQTVEKIYSRDENIWHISHEGGNLENPWNEYKKDIHVLSCEPEDAPDKPEYVVISFEKGIPVALDGEKMDAVTLLAKLNAGICDR